ncbi:hypothetical protein MMC07_009505 [Pseudocyphellaria aurata]|nr:hypothetical protein [Pseudocyphellaria aurata]
MSHVYPPAVSVNLWNRVSPDSKPLRASSATYKDTTGAKSFSAGHKRQSSIRDLYSSRPANRSSLQVNGDSKLASKIGNSSRAASIRRWDGNRRTTTVWDSLRRDRELWFADGDCLVHFYEPGQSRRGASLRIALADIEASDCKPFLDCHCPMDIVEFSSPKSPSLSFDGEHVHSHESHPRYEIYVPAPLHLSSADAFRFHLTTRNFFAWMYDLPIVGDRLGEALNATLERMSIYRPDREGNLKEFLLYLDSQGYTDFRECPDHSLAILQFAEKYELKDLWTDAFVHCVGMNDNLILSGEFKSISRASKALITRAYLEMNVRLERTGRSLETFLDEDLSGAYLGLGVAAHTHLERFRSWLISFYVCKFGYWPPAPADGNSKVLPQSVYRSMYFEFRKLYEYLVDPLSSNSIRDNRPADGGLCVLQNIKAFDTRHKYSSLPHPLPLVPEIPRSMHKQKSSALLRVFGNRQAKWDRRATALAALSAATNPDNIAVMECPLVREYLYFERTWTMKECETVTCAEARKVRWILIYAVLQTLICVTRAPKEVRDTHGVSYPLCCQVAGTPPWKSNLDPAKERRVGPLTEDPEKVIEIKPDVDFSSPEQIALALSTDSPHPLSLSPHIPIVQDLNMDPPLPLEAGTCAVSCQEYGDGMYSAYFDSDTSTPSSVIGRADSGGWSLSSSDDGMEHTSVDGNVSNYGENGQDRSICGKHSPLELATKISADTFRPDTRSPELDRYIWA